MRPTFLVATTLALGALAAPAVQAAPSGTVYNVTVSGTQQFDQTDIEIADPQPAKCFDARGTTTQKTVATFTSTKPVRVKVIRSGRGYRLTTVGGPEGVAWDWPLRVSFKHSGSAKRDTKKLDCVTWVPDPPREEKNRSAALDNFGGGLSNETIPKGGRVTFSGGEDLPMPGNPFDGCPWGDHSLGIYAAKGKINAQAILDSVASAFTLQGEEKSKYSTPQGDSTSYTKTTSVRLKFMRVKG